MSVRFLGLCLAAALFVAAAPVPRAGAADLVPLTIDTASGSHAFRVEIAADDSSRETGLMYRRHLDADYGMLFDFAQTQPVAMWMKNTYVPLDMVFILPGGVVHRVEENTDPLSERVIESGVPVRYVLELPAGTAAKIGLKRGDRIHTALIDGK
jgi:uncharacterized membrane protein (UPF0127 family)